MMKAFTLVAGLLGPAAASAAPPHNPADSVQQQLPAAARAEPQVPPPDVCTAYAACRGLTAGEKKMAARYFGASLPYDAIRIVNQRFLGLFPIGAHYTGISPDGNIYATAERVQSADYSREPQKSRFFIHEMAHVAQHYAGMNLLQQAFALHSFTQGDPYAYVLEKDRPLADYNIEQQARMVEMLHIYTQHLDSNRTIHGDSLGRIDKASLCRAWDLHREKLAGVLRPQPAPALCR